MLRRAIDGVRAIVSAASAGADATIEQEKRARLDSAKNPFTRYGAHVFSQSDEDGLTMEIVRRIGLEFGTYCELGVGNGTECNTLVLAMQGWRGFWISDGALAFDPGGAEFLRYDRQRITRINLLPLIRRNLFALGAPALDVMSIDLDGNDLHFVGDILDAGIRPHLFIVEYNAKFPPPLRWTVKQDDSFAWAQSDYMGASLQSFADVFGAAGYRLICCNAATGANAFFVREEHAALFPEVPRDVAGIYMSPCYRVARNGHRPDVRTVEAAIRQGCELRSRHLSAPRQHLPATAIADEEVEHAACQRNR